MTTAAPSERVRRLSAPGYLILSIALILPMIDMIMSVLPVKFGMVAWRFGTLGLFASAVGAPVLVLFLIYALALNLGDRRVVVACGALAAFLALLLIAGIGTFALDALQMKPRIQAAGLPRFYTASAQALIKLTLQGVAALVLAISIFRSLRDPKLAPSRAERNPAANLVVGRNSTGRLVDRDQGLPRALVEGNADQKSTSEAAEAAESAARVQTEE